MNGNRTVRMIRKCQIETLALLGQRLRRVAIAAMVVANSVIGLSVVSLEAARPAEALFQEALLKETGERDVEGALSIYKVIVQQAGDDRLLRAKAQLRIGICYERLEKVPEAIAAYEEVVMQTATTPTEIAQIAQTNLQRLQTKMEQEQKARMALAEEAKHIRVKVHRRWSMSVQGGQARLPSSPKRFLDHQEVIWGSVEYRPSVSLKVGLEGGYFFPAETRRVEESVFRILEGDLTRSRTSITRNSAGYLGPFVQWYHEKGMFSFRLGGGAGAAIEHTRETITFEGAGVARAELSSKEIDIEPAISLTSGLDITLTKWLGIGVGLRDLAVIQRDTVFLRSGTEDRVRVHHILIPFVRASLRF